MAYGREVFAGKAEVMSDGREDDRTDEPTLSEEELERRAQYLAKAASLGQMVWEDDSLDPER